MHRLFGSEQNVQSYFHQIARIQEDLAKSQTSFVQKNTNYLEEQGKLAALNMAKKQAQGQRLATQLREKGRAQAAAVHAWAKAAQERAVRIQLE